MGKKVMKLFLDTMLRAAVIILAVAIVVMLVLLARTVSKSKKSDASDTGNKTSIVTEESDPSDPTHQRMTAQRTLQQRVQMQEMARMQK